MSWITDSVVQASGVVHDDRLWLHVDDDGPGIDPSHRDDHFRRFSGLDEARTHRLRRPGPGPRDHRRRRHRPRRTDRARAANTRLQYPFAEKADQ